MKVAVVTISFNAEKEIETTIQSVLKQTYADFEYIVQDGKSTDATLELINKYKHRFVERNLKFSVESNSDNGIYNAMNKAVKRCNSEWIIFMNAGDEFYDKDVLKDIFEYRKWEGIDLIYGNVLFKINNQMGMIQNCTDCDLYERWSLCHQSIFERSSLLLTYPFDESYKIVSDYDHVLTLKQQKYNFAKVNSIISVMNREGISSQRLFLLKNENTMLAKKFNMKIEERKKNNVRILIQMCLKRYFKSLDTLLVLKNSSKRVMRIRNEEK